MKFDVVQAWLDNVAYAHTKSEGTAANYRRFLLDFCKLIDKTPQQILNEYEGMRDREFRRKYAQYIRLFIAEKVRNDFATGTIRAMVYAIKSFFKYNDLPLGHVPVARNTTKFHNRDIKKDEIIAVLNASRPRDRAFFCMMAQTGLRPITLTKLKYKHIQKEFESGILPCKIDIPKEIAKGQYRSYFTFMGEESIKFLKSYLATRIVQPESYLFTSHGVEKRLHPKSIARIFRGTIDRLKKKGLIDFKDRQFNKPGEVRLYNLRKFFRKYANQAGFEFVQFWMGHIVKEGDEEHYRPKDVEFHRKLYSEKAMPFLRFETATPTETDRIIQSQAQEIEMLTKRVQTLENFIGDQDIILYKSKPKYLEKGIETLRKENPELARIFETWVKSRYTEFLKNLLREELKAIEELEKLPIEERKKKTLEHFEESHRKSLKLVEELEKKRKKKS